MKFNVSHLDKHTFINAYLMPYEMYAVAKLKHTEIKTMNHLHNVLEYPSLLTG